MEMTLPVGRAGSPAEWQEAERKGWYRAWGVSTGGLGDAVPGLTRWLGAGGRLIPQSRSPAVPGLASPSSKLPENNNKSKKQKAQKDNQKAGPH